jgi:hypothetical protein
MLAIVFVSTIKFRAALNQYKVETLHVDLIPLNCSDQTAVFFHLLIRDCIEYTPFINFCSGYTDDWVGASD